MINQRKLFMEAKKAKKNAYAPYSRFFVGAALLSSSGKLFTGSNVENASYGGTICAERSAMIKAINQGERSFEALAVAGNEGPLWPCGICLQFLVEFAPELSVITGEDEDHLESKSLKELLPKGFLG